MSSIVSIDTRGYDISMGPGVLRVGGGGGLAGNVYINGNVGIGTANPRTALDVSNVIAIKSQNTVGYNQTSTLGFGYAGGSTNGTDYRWKVDDITYNRDSGVGPYYDYGAQSKLIFRCKSNNLYNGTANDKVYQDGLCLVPNSPGNGGLSTGINVGIGAITPTSTLHVYGTPGTTALDRASTGVANTITGKIQFNNGGAEMASISSGLNVGGIANNGDLRFHTRLDLNNYIERMRIDRAGLVGIGTTSPAATLDVVGSASAYNIPKRWQSDILVGGNYSGGLARYYLLGTLKDNNVGDGYGTMNIQGTLGGFTNDSISVIDAMITTRSGIKTSGLLKYYGSIGANICDIVVYYTGTTGTTSGPQYFVYLKTNIQLSSTVYLYFDLAVTTGFTSTSQTTNSVWIAEPSNTFITTTPTGTNVITSLIASIGNKITIDTDGKVGIGTSSPSRLLDVRGDAQIGVSTNKCIEIISGTTDLTYINFHSKDALYNNYDTRITSTGGGTSSQPQRGNLLYSALNHAFNTGGTDRMTITSNGSVGIGTTSPTANTYLDINYFKFYNTGYASFYRQSSTATDGAFDINSNWGATNRFVFSVRSDGNVINWNASYGAISDVRFKENIIDTPPKLEDLKKVRIVNYNIIGDTDKSIGVIAQELENIFPRLVEESVDKITNTPYKTVKYSIFIPILIKAVQEQQAQIEELQIQNQTQQTLLEQLQQRIQALENK